MENRPVYYSQTDPRWANTLYDINPSDGDDYLKTAGCGPSTAAMVVATFCDKNVYPPDMARFAIAQGDRTQSNGTKRTLFLHTAKKYALQFRQIDVADRTNAAQARAAMARAKPCLEEGGLVACHVGKSRWTNGGHYILWWKYAHGVAWINDPSGDTARRNSAPEEELQAATGAYMCFWPPEEEEMTKEAFASMMEEYLAGRAQLPGSEWSADARAWSVEKGIIQGDDQGAQKWKSFPTREEVVAMLRRSAGAEGGKSK